MNRAQLTTRSKFLSLVLRHQPELLDLTLDDAGWVAVDQLLDQLQSSQHPLTREQLQDVVQKNSKQRFEFSEDGSRIRARQGHSIPVDLGYAPQSPPEILYHGTPEQFVESIRQSGLKPQQRHAVHLHSDANIAREVGRRRGRAVLLQIAACAMHRAGHQFAVTGNGVWLTAHVPPEFIRFPEQP
ncbi:MAG: RNA 2'-phosphotransferase [Planctomycetaceae bacterium]|nr:RNA 2'-phosphotransferase [Planctomycetaceae bacterium]